MSLTQEMADPSSPLQIHMKTRFPNTRAAIFETNRQLQNAHTLQPPPNAPYALIGTAIDYRVRYMFPNPEPMCRTIAWLGWAALQTTVELSEHKGTTYGQVPGAGPGRFSMDAIQDFLEETDSMLRRIKPAQGNLTAQQEFELSRHCLALAMMENCYRTHPQRNTLLHSRDIDQPKDVTKIINDGWVQDMARLAKRSKKTLGQLLTHPHRSNPEFAGSSDVGGADADIIIDDCLLDLKTTIKPRLDGKWIHQLLGYALLDYRDEHKIRSVGIMLTRQSHIIRWQLDQLMDTTSNGTAGNLAAERHLFQKAIEPLARQIAQQNDNYTSAVNVR